MGRSMSCIFLSHSSLDNFHAIAIRDWLAREGWDDVFLDLDPDRGIAPGERWERALHEAATRCEAVIFLVSANWLKSGWCLREHALARALNKKLFAVVIDPEKPIHDLPPELKDTWQVVNLTGGQDGLLLKIPLPGSHEERHVVFSNEGLRRLKHGLEKAGLDPKYFAWPPESDSHRAPYRGLEPLEDVDAGIFFGRDAPIVEGIEKLRGLSAAAAPRILVILGASGAGKSSFLRAGLLPRLRRDDRNFLVLSVIRPERAALTGDSGLLGALESALPSHTRPEIRAAIQAGEAGVRPLLKELVSASLTGALTSQDQDKPPMVILAIDQAEELFRAHESGEGTALLSLVKDLTVDDAPAVIAIFAIRSDSYDALEHAEALKGLLSRTTPINNMAKSALDHFAALLLGLLSYPRIQSAAVGTDKPLGRGSPGQLTRSDKTSTLGCVMFAAIVRARSSNQSKPNQGYGPANAHGQLACRRACSRLVRNPCGWSNSPRKSMAVSPLVRERSRVQSSPAAPGYFN
jgi:hypothetical protein